MPTYQYQCTECGDGLEVVQKFTDDSLTECPACSGRLKKVFSAVGIVFKGSGFYRNDSRGARPAALPPPTAPPRRPRTARSPRPARVETKSSGSDAKSTTASAGSSSSSGSKSTSAA